MKNELVVVKIPFWYKFFIRFMKNFYENMPHFKNVSCTTRIDIIQNSFFYNVEKGEEKGPFLNTQEAYLKVRWEAMWIDFWWWDSDVGINWCIIEKKMKYEFHNRV